MENIVKLNKLRYTFQTEICQLLEMGGELMMGLLPNATDKLSLNVPVEQLQQKGSRRRDTTAPSTPASEQDQRQKRNQKKLPKTKTKQNENENESNRLCVW